MSTNGKKNGGFFLGDIDRERIMRNAGLFRPFRILIGENFLDTLGRCLLVTPLGMLLVGVFFESRIVPLAPDKQFLSFMPGDIFLSVCCALLLATSDGLPDKKAWYNSRAWHWIVLVGCFIVATVFHFVVDGKAYPPRALNGPTKLYHDFALVWLYFYVMFSVGVGQLLAGKIWGWRLLVAVPWLVWVWFMFQDSTFDTTVNAAKALTAHPEDWKPIWRFFLNSR